MKLTDRQWCWIAFIVTVIGAVLTGIFGEGTFWLSLIAFLILLTLFGGYEE